MREVDDDLDKLERNTNLISAIKELQHVKNRR